MNPLTAARNARITAQNTYLVLLNESADMMACVEAFKAFQAADRALNTLLEGMLSSVQVAA